MKKILSFGALAVAAALMAMPAWSQVGSSAGSNSDILKSSPPNVAPGASAATGSSSTLAPSTSAASAQDMAGKLATEISTAKARGKSTTAAETHQKEGIQALKSGDEASAKKHFTLAEEALGMNSGASLNTGMSAAPDMGSVPSGLAPSKMAPDTGMGGAAPSTGGTAPSTGGASDSGGAGAAPGAGSAAPRY